MEASDVDMAISATETAAKNRCLKAKACFMAFNISIRDANVKEGRQSAAVSSGGDVFAQKEKPPETQLCAGRIHILRAYVPMRARLTPDEASSRQLHRLTLARLKATLGLVDDVNAALTAHDAIVAMTRAQRLQRISNFHMTYRSVKIEEQSQRHERCQQDLVSDPQLGSPSWGVSRA